MADEGAVDTGARSTARRRYREAVLDAALDVFSEKGYQEAQIGEIALKARVAVGTLYSFFENKESLYREVMSMHAVEIGVAFNEVFESGLNESEKILRYIRAKGEIFQANSKAVRLYFAQMQGARLNVRATLGEDFRRIYDLLLNRLVEVFQSGIDKGVFLPLDPLTLAVALDSATNACIVLCMDHPERHPYETHAEEISRLFFEGILLHPEVSS